MQAVQVFGKKVNFNKNENQLCFIHLIEPHSVIDLYTRGK